MATRINVDGTVEELVIDKKDRLASLQAAVGGLIEEVCGYKGRIVLVDEEGCLKDYDINRVASVMLGRLLVGPVLLVSSPEEYR